MTQRASGDFDVTLSPLDVHAAMEPDVLGRRALDKRFHGPLEATSRGEMLSAMSAVKGSGVYVAIEKVTGTLEGREGSFVLHHTGLMNRGAPTLTISVVPDSGTGALAGLSGTMSITIAAGKHSYEFEYSLDGAPAPSST